MGTSHVVPVALKHLVRWLLCLIQSGVKLSGIGTEFVMSRVLLIFVIEIERDEIHNMNPM
jgi:hypothetical protein